MSKSKKRKNVSHHVPKVDTEGKYQKLYMDYVERDELEFFNRKSEERVKQMQEMLWEREAKAEHERLKQERKLNAIMSLVAMIFLCLVCIASLCTLSYTVGLSWIVTAIVSSLLAVCTAFRSGYLWHEIKKG